MSVSVEILKAIVASGIAETDEDRKKIYGPFLQEHPEITKEGVLGGAAAMINVIITERPEMRKYFEDKLLWLGVKG